MERVKQAHEQAKKRLEDATNTIESLVKEIEGLQSHEVDLTKELLLDLTGQVMEAFSKKEYFDKWGIHYLLSLNRAHQLQQCNNFKDPGIQNYGGTSFMELRDTVDDLFTNLPAPKPSANYGYYGNHGGRSAGGQISRSAGFSMASFNSRNNACFDGNCSVTLANGSFTLVKDLRKGDLVLSKDSNSTSSMLGVAEIVCVVKTSFEAGRTLLCELENNLFLTPYHPVRLHGNHPKGELGWAFPCDVASAYVRERKCEAVYSFILNNGHSMFVNGVEALSLGHGVTADKIAKHEYFGTKKIIEDLQTIHPHGFAHGLVHFTSESMLRDQRTGLLCGFDAAKLVLEGRSIFDRIELN